MLDVGAVKVRWAQFSMRKPLQCIHHFFPGIDVNGTLLVLLRVRVQCSARGNTAVHKLHEHGHDIRV